MAPTRVAAIDCGTNTIRLLIADAHPDPDSGPTGWRLKKVARRSKIVRLGQGVDKTGRLDDEALQRTLEVVADYAERIQAIGAERVRFVATSATRDASNRDVFVDGVRQRLGIEPEVVSGDEEARLSFAGSLLGAQGQGRRLVVDLGGGSTELVLGTRAPEAAISLDTGSVRVTERYLADGVTPDAEAAARAHVRDLLDRAEGVMDLGATEELVGLAGTITTITAHALSLADFEPDSIHGSRLPLGTVLASCDAILRSTAAERESWDYLRPGRRDVIAAGALVWSEVIGRVAERTAEAGHPLESTVTSLTDILDGIALSLADGGAQHDG